MTIAQLQAMIGEWHRSVFGEYNAFDHVCAIAMKAREESGELADASLAGRYNEACIEIADLIICALGAADRLGMDAEGCILRKLQELHERGKTQLDRDKERGIIQAHEMK